MSSVHFSFTLEDESNSGRVSFTLPLKTLSEANLSEHWTKRAARHKEQKLMVGYAMTQVKQLVKMPCTIIMKRYGKRLLDAHDNLPISFKHVADQISKEITGDIRPGRADNNPGLTFKYDQEKSKEYFIKVTIEF